MRRAELEQRPKTKNPLKAYVNYRAARMLLAASKSLYFSTKVTILFIDAGWQTLTSVNSLAGSN